MARCFRWPAYLELTEHRHVSRSGSRYVLRQGRGDRRGWRSGGRSQRTARRPASGAAHERAESRGLVAGRMRGRRPAAGRHAGSGGHRPVGPDARRRAARRAWPRAAQRDPVERRPGASRMRRPGAQRGRAGHHRQPRHARLHGAEAAVGACPRAGCLRPHPNRAAAQGLPALSNDRRAGQRHVRRLGHAVARRRPAALVGSHAGRHRPRPRQHAALGGRRGHRRPLAAAHRRRMGHAAGAGGGRRRRSGGRRSGRGGRAARRELFCPWAPRASTSYPTPPIGRTPPAACMRSATRCRACGIRCR